MRIAIVHDWLVNKRGAERVLECICGIFPDADIFTLIYSPHDTFESFKAKRISTSFIQKLPFSNKHFRIYLALFPAAIRSFSLEGYDIVISINHCVAKGVRFDSSAIHISYCLTPMRYVWVFKKEYFGIFDSMLAPFINYLKGWDEAQAGNVDHFVAVSNHIRKRIKICYRRGSSVIFPPVETGYFLTRDETEREDFYLIVSELVPYKSVDLAIEAFNEMGRRLVIIGDGPCRKRLARRAGKNIIFVDWQSPDRLKKYYQAAKALVYPQEEDFGITAVEAQAAGCPVIAYRCGGAEETVVENKTGVFFDSRSKESLIDAVLRFDCMRFDHKDIVDNSTRFDKEIFAQRFKEFVNGVR